MDSRVPLPLINDIPHRVICETFAAACIGNHIEGLKEKNDTQALEE
jgi:hypothetical protein